MTSSPIQLEKLAHATANWLSFYDLCGLEKMLNEASLTFPLATFLGVHSSRTLKTQYPHPLFAQKAGRPRQIDFVLLNTKNELLEAYECKWADTTNENLVKDIYRLESLVGVLNGHQVQRFFIVAGPTNKTNALARRGVNENGKRIELSKSLLSFSKKDPERAFRINDSPSQLRKYVKKFQNDYYPQASQKNIPTVISTKLVADANTDHYRVLVWRVSRKGGVKCVRLK